MKLIIPARKGSKGFPFKNRKLMNITFDILPSKCHDVIVTSDDEVVLEEAAKRGFHIIDRSKELSSDTASVKDVLLDVIERMKFDDYETIIMLYLTYITRLWRDVIKAVDFFNRNDGAQSLLCRYKAETHPYLCAYEVEGNKGKQIVEHDLYRRQDYPKVFEISHYIFIAFVDEIKKLNKNLYNENTIFFEIEKPIDVDYEEDFMRGKNGFRN